LLGLFVGDGHQIHFALLHDRFDPPEMLEQNGVFKKVSE
jgi:hypothetical protein